MPILDKPGDIAVVKSKDGWPLSEAAIQAINHMLRTSVIVPAGRNGEIEWRAYFDGTELTLTLDRNGKVLGSSSSDD